MNKTLLKSIELVKYNGTNTMVWKEGNILVWYKLGQTIVIPTNAGWKSNGENVMGAGIAKEASLIVPKLPSIYGEFCQQKNPRVYLKELHLICVPSKPLNTSSPHLSWKQDADFATVRTSLEWLEANSEQFPNPVYVPLLGAGNGGLDKDLVRELMDSILKNEKFIGVIW